MPAPNVPLCYIDSFELKALEKQQMHREREKGRGNEIL